MDNIYKVLNQMMSEGGLTDDTKKGILVGIELMGYQGEKWLDNEEHAINFRNNTKRGDGWSGWKETYDHVAGFMFSEQPNETQIKNYKLVTCENDDDYDDDDEDDEDDEWTSFLKGDAYKNSDVFPFTNNHILDVGPQNPLKSAEEIKEEYVGMKNDCGDMEISEDEEDYEENIDEWKQYMYENVEYLLGPDGEGGLVVLETEDYQQVGVFKDEKIVFEDYLQFENHLDRVRESTIPQDTDEAFELVSNFIKDNYDLKMYVYPKNKYDPPAIYVFNDKEERKGMWLHFIEKYTSGKNMGEFMKEIETII